MTSKPTYQELQHRIKELEEQADRCSPPANLRENEGFLRKILHTSVAGLYVYDLKRGNNVFINRRYTELTGYILDKINSMSKGEFAALFHPDDRARVVNHMQAVVRAADGETVEIEYRFKTADGRWIWCFSRDTVFTRDADGSVRQFLGTFLDITARKEAEAALRQSREDMDRAQAVGQIGWWRLDARRNVLTWSDENHRIFGVPEKTPMSYETFLGIVHPDDRQYVDTQWNAGLRGDPYDIEHRIVVEGRVKWVREKAYLEYDNGGEILGGFGITQDITERKRAEEALQQSEARYRSFIELTGQLGWTTNADGEVVEDLPSWREFTGQSEEEIKGWGWSKALHPDDLEQTARVWRKAIAARNRYEVEYRIRRYDGVYRHFLARGIPVLRDDGRVREWVGTCIDISERKEMEERLRRSHDELEIRVQERTAELERSNRELQDFAFIASHDLREPLRKIRTFGDMLADRCGESLDETSRDCIRRMQRAAGRMGNFINSLLAYSRVTTRAEPMQEMDLRPCVEAALSNLEVAIKEKNATVELGELPTLRVDGVQMIQLFQNLIGNALKFSRDGEAPHVKINARQVGRSAYEIRVEDNGIGFEEQYLDKIFLPFQRLYGRSDYEGLGMGLAICRKIVERHKGEISAGSTLGKGSTFVVKLPGEGQKQEMHGG